MSEIVDIPYLPAVAPEQAEKDQETARSYPEIVGDLPLENTSFVYSIPAMGEWRNGNLKRQIHAFLSQRVDSPFEIEILTNIGPQIEQLLVPDEDTVYKKNRKGEYILAGDNLTDQQIKARRLLDEVDEANNFIKSLIEVQQISRACSENPDNQELKNSLEDVLKKFSDPIEMNIAKLAMGKANSISLFLVNCSRTVFRDTPYYPTDLDSLRTLGLDIIYDRFASKKQDISVGIYDADTIPEDNRTVARIQRYFAESPQERMYLFTGTSSVPPGFSKDYLADAPRDQVKRLGFYNATNAHTTAQINFRLEAYKDLSEISSWQKNGFTGYNDFDTAIRLVSLFGNFEKGTLWNSAAVYPPTALSQDRMDGQADSEMRRRYFNNLKTQDLTVELPIIEMMRKRTKDFTSTLSTEEQSLFNRYEHEARSFFLDRQRVQQRLNRFVANTFLTASEKGLIHAEAGGLVVNREAISRTIGGQALLHFIENNQSLAAQVLQSPQDIHYMSYLLGNSDELPEGFTPNAFQKALREYLGEVTSYAEAEQQTKKTDQLVDGLREVRILDTRAPESRASFLHPVTAEILTLGYLFNVFHERKDFEARMNQSKNPSEWFTEHENDLLPLRYGDLDNRLDWMHGVIGKT